VTGELGDGVERLEFSRSGQLTRIKVIMPSRSSRVEDTDLIVKVPQGSSLFVNTVSADVRSRSLRGSQRLQSVSGDIEAAQEADLVARLGRSLRSQVLLEPHHGSRTSSTEAFVQAVAPGTALVQAAYRSRFGHPAPQVQARYREWGVELLRSDRCGAWSWSSDGASRCERQSAARYWHHRPDADAPHAP